jgi:hypothetical protein
VSFVVDGGAGFRTGFPVGRFRVEGDPGAIRGSAQGWLEFGIQACEAAADIRSLDTSLFIGTEADIYREGLDGDLAPHLDTTGQAYSAVGSALASFAQDLDGLQARMAPLTVRAPNLWDARQSAHATLDAARWADTAHHQSRDADQAALPPGEHLPIDTYHSEVDSAGSALSAAEQAWQDCLSAATAIKTELNTAIDTCCHAIKAASGHRFARNPHGLGALSSGFTHFVKDHAAGLAKLSAGLKFASGIFTVLSVIPVLDLATAPLALATAATALAIDASIKTATGQGSWTNIGIDAALLALPGAAHLATPLLAGTRLATTTARAGEAGSTAGRAARGFTTSLTTDLKATRLGIATTPTGITTILKDGKTTGQMLTDAKAAAKAAAGRSTVGPEGDRPLFVNRAPDDPLAGLQTVPLERLRQINGTYNYVVRSDGKLFVGRVGHIDLARGAPVQAAGEVKVVNGQVRMFDNASGHYRPTGPSIEPAARAAFEQQAGLHVRPDAYKPLP